MSTIRIQDLSGFQIGYGAFLYGRPPGPTNRELDVAVVIDDHDDVAEIRTWLHESAAQFEREHGIRVDGLVMTESDWLDRQARIFGTHPHMPLFATVDTWEDIAYVPIYNERYIKEKIDFCSQHPIEGVKAINQEMRFGSVLERR